MLNILTDPLIRVSVTGGTSLTSLPEVLAALLADDVEAFPALRPHQRHAWHAFLVQLGAMALHRAGISEPPADAAEWAGLIRALTSKWPDDEPWQLVVDDITKPAFMQPPASSQEREKDYKNRVESADELDMLVTSKNHDLKSAIGTTTGADDWLFALVTLQTMEGFGGAGNYGISRMNGGLGSRPAFSMAPTGGIGAHVNRDLRALLVASLSTEGGHSLLWLLTWDGTASERLLLHQLAPLYIEICRRIRLRSDDDGRLHAVRTSSKAARIEGKDLKGRTGDPWTPHNSKRDGLPLTLANGGFTYKRVTDYLFNSDWDRPDLIRATPAEQSSDDTMQLVARAMVRGQGKTEGYYERVIPLKPKTAQVFGRGGSTQDIGDIARERIAQVGIVQRILRHAIITFIGRGESGGASPEQRALANPWANRLDEIVDAGFFDALQDEFEQDHRAERDRVRNIWLMNNEKSGVVDHARNILNEAVDSLPCPAIHRYKAREVAVGLFEGRMRGNSGIPDLFNAQGDANE